MLCPYCGIEMEEGWYLHINGQAFPKYALDIRKGRFLDEDFKVLRVKALRCPKCGKLEFFAVDD